MQGVCVAHTQAWVYILGSTPAEPCNALCPVMSGPHIGRSVLLGGLAGGAGEHRTLLTEGCRHHLDEGGQVTVALEGRRGEGGEGRGGEGRGREGRGAKRKGARM